MAGIKEYIEWRGDIDLGFDPFGEVDALVLAQLVYLPLEHVLSTGETNGLPYSLTLREAAERFDPDKVEEKLRIYTFDRDTEFLRLAGESERFGGLRVGGYEVDLAPENDQQFAAMTFDLPSGERFIAFRGTDDTIAGWKEDFNFSYMAETPAQRLAVGYLERHAGENIPLMTGGHSKGGNLAVYSAMRSPEEVRSRLVNIYSFDSPGFRDEVAQSEEYKRVLPYVTCFIPESSLVGQLLTENTEHMIVRSDAAGVMQHMSYSWQIKRNKFVRAEKLSDFGMFINRTVSGWLKDLNDEDRRMFTKAVFDMIESSDAETLSELGKSKLKSPAALLKAFSTLRPEQQQAVKHALKELAKSGRNALF